MNAPTTTVSSGRLLGSSTAAPASMRDMPTYCLSPAQHASLVLPAKAKGILVFGRWAEETKLDRKGARITERVYRQAGAKHAEIEQAIAGIEPVLMAMNSFRECGRYGAHYSHAPDRRLTNLATLRAAWVELDYYKTRAWARYAPHAMVAHVLARLRDEHIPAPSYIVSSGRGLHAVWLLDGAPSVALPAWKALQHRLNETLRDMGTDRVAAAPTGNLRLTGTWNRGALVTMIWPATVGEIFRYGLRGLCDEVLPYTPEQCREYRERKAAQREARSAVARQRVARGGSPALTGESYWATIERDLWRLLDLRYPAGVKVVKTEDEDGSHGRHLFAFAKVWAWQHRESAVVRELIERHARRLGFTPKAALREALGVLRLLGCMERGEGRFAEGATGPYRVGPRTLVKEFGITPREARDADLRMLVPVSMKAERVCERAAKSRAAKGATPRADVQAERLAIGQQALRLRDEEGLTRAQICTRLGVKPARLDKALAEAKAVAAIGTVSKPKRMAKIAPAEQPEPVDEASCVSSRYIGSVDGAADDLAACEVEP
ncbi:MAG: hypothetical protein K2X54_09470 [Methylobacterium organophilum]|nr:hypothetical protein [Methylobacterium organophilum]